MPAKRAKGDVPSEARPLLLANEECPHFPEAPNPAISRGKMPRFKPMMHLLPLIKVRGRDAWQMVRQPE